MPELNDNWDSMSSSVQCPLCNSCDVCVRGNGDIYGVLVQLV